MKNKINHIKYILCILLCAMLIFSISINAFADELSDWADYDRISFYSIDECSLENCNYAYRTDPINNIIYILIEATDRDYKLVNPFTEYVNIQICAEDDAIYDEIDIPYSAESKAFAGSNKSCAVSASWLKGALGEIHAYLTISDFSKSMLNNAFKIKLTISGANGIISGKYDDNVIDIYEFMPLQGEEITTAETTTAKSASKKSGSYSSGKSSSKKNKATETEKEDYPSKAAKDIIDTTTDNESISLSKGKMAIIIGGAVLLGSAIAMVLLLAEKNVKKKSDKPDEDLSEDDESD